MTTRCCSVVDGECLAPAAILVGSGIGFVDNDPKDLVKCRLCGEDVCKRCSSITMAHTTGPSGRTAMRNVRVCNTCKESGFR